MQGIRDFDCCETPLLKYSSVDSPLSVFNRRVMVSFWLLAFVKLFCGVLWNWTSYQRSWWSFIPSVLPFALSYLLLGFISCRGKFRKTLLAIAIICFICELANIDFTLEFFIYNRFKPDIDDYIWIGSILLSACAWGYVVLCLVKAVIMKKSSIMRSFPVYEESDLVVGVSTVEKVRDYELILRWTFALLIWLFALSYLVDPVWLNESIGHNRYWWAYPYLFISISVFIFLGFLALKESCFRMLFCISLALLVDSSVYLHTARNIPIPLIIFHVSELLLVFVACLSALLICLRNNLLQWNLADRFRFTKAGNYEGNPIAKLKQ